MTDNQTVNVDDLNRDELNAYAATLGISDPSVFGKKADLLDAVKKVQDGASPDDVLPEPEPQEPVDQSTGQDGPVAGGVYIVNGKRVNANGEPVKG